MERLCDTLAASPMAQTATSGTAAYIGQDLLALAAPINCWGGGAGTIRGMQGLTCPLMMVKVFGINLQHMHSDLIRGWIGWQFSWGIGSMIRFRCPCPLLGRLPQSICPSCHNKNCNAYKISRYLSQSRHHGPTFASKRYPPV